MFLRNSYVLKKCSRHRRAYIPCIVAALLALLCFCVHAFNAQAQENSNQLQAASNSQLQVSNNNQLQATSNADIYTVTFNAGGLTSNKTVTGVAAGSSVERPAIYASDNKLKKLQGWYKDSSYNTPWDFSKDILCQIMI